MTLSCVIKTTALVIVMAAPASAQQSSSGGAHRPWVGVGFGPGMFTGPELEGPDLLLSATFEVPLAPVAGVRISAERIWTSARDYGDASLRQFSADIMMRRPISSNSACDTQAVVGLGAGIYAFTFESGPLEEATQAGYQINAGADCVGGRLAIGGLFGFRFIRAPDHPAFAGDVVIAGSLSLTVRIRF